MQRFKLPEMNSELRPLVVKRKKRFDKHFRHTNYRPSQLEAIVLISELLKDHDNIVLEAPTGSGKSDIAMTICDAFSKVKEWNFGMLSSQLNLMAQYKTDFPELKELKGRKNFACDIEPCTAATAQCVTVKNFKCPVDAFQDGKRFHTCGYYAQKREAEASIGYISTPWYVFLETTRLTSKFRKRDLVVLDEAHNIENIMVEQLQENWTNKMHKYLIDNTTPFPNYPEAWTEDGMGNNAWLRYFGDCVKSAESKRKILIEKRKNLGGRKDEGLEKEWLFFNDMVGRLKRLTALLQAPHSILADVKNNRWGTSASFKPLSVRNFAPDIFKRISKKRIFMSATLDPKLFVDTLGLDTEKTAYIEISKSNFELEKRIVNQANVSKMNFHHAGYRNTIPKIGDFIRKRLLDNIGENALIYAPSYELCNKLADYLKPYHDKILTHNEQDRDEVISKFIGGQGYALISPSITEGYDLKGDICRLLIIVKIPFPNIGDNLVRRRMMMHERDWRDKYEGSALCPYEEPLPGQGSMCSNYGCSKPCQSHYRAQAAFKLVQIIGRGVRDSKDYCDIWILDSGFANFYRTAIDFMPEWFRESIRKV